MIVSIEERVRRAKEKRTHNKAIMEQYQRPAPKPAKATTGFDRRDPR